MRPKHVIRGTSAVAAGIAAAGLATWFSLDAVKQPAERTVTARVSPPGPLRRQLPPESVVSPDVLPQLHAGMPRAEVEQLLGPPGATDVQAVGESNGRPTYHTTYPLALDGSGGGASRRVPGAGPRSFVGLEFDATLPGHPLINVVYPDPLF